jgi:glucokinase
VPTEAQRPAEQIAASMAALCHKICKEYGIGVEDIDSVDIASPDICDHDTGVVVYTNNLPFHQFEICDLIKKDFPAKAFYIENDANAAAWGEAIAGAAKGSKTSVMITLGTGVGGGIIIDNKVFSGFNYAGAELGHIVIVKDGVQCSCGRKGCWEAYSSATALIRMTREKIEECAKSGRETLMSKLAEEKGKVSGRTAFDALRAGDEAAKEVVDTYVDYLATGIGNVINIFQPEVLSLGGGVSGEGQYLLDMLIPKVRAEQYGGGLVQLTDIRIAKLGNDAGIVGAAVLGL